MRLKENLSVRKIGDEYMMVSEIGSCLDYTRVISLNSTAAFLINETQQKDFTTEDWANLLINKYNVDRDIALRDANNLINKLLKEQLVTD